MQITDAKKTINIGVIGFTDRFCGIPMTEFKIEITNPIVIDGTFTTNDIKQINTGVYTIHFSEYSPISNAFGGNGKQDMYLRIPKEAYSWIMRESNKCIENKKIEANSKIVNKWYLTQNEEYLTISIYPDIDMLFREDLQFVKTTIEKHQGLIISELKENSKPTNNSGLSQNLTWYEIDNEIIMKLCNMLVYMGEKKKEIKEAEYKALEVVAVNKAIAMNEKQIIRAYAVPCSDSSEECSIDIITEYVYPDGKKEMIQNHTW
jgi:hypothetical protein